MLNPCLGLSEQVGKLMLSGDKLRDQDTLAILVAEEEDVHTDMLGERKLHRVQGKLNGTGVVAKRVVGPEETTPKFARSQHSQIISSAVDTIARSSASVLEWETPVCFLDFQASREEPKNRQKPVTERRSEGSLAQVASE